MGAPDHDADPSVSIHAGGSGHAKMPILGQGTQRNYFGGVDNRDIRVVIVHERDVIDLDGGSPRRVSVEIANHGLQARRLSLRAHGLPLATVEPEIVSVRPGEEARAWLVLSSTPTKPEAGRRPVQVVATDADGSYNFWESNEKTVDVPARPKVTVSEVPHSGRTSGVGPHRLAATVRNAGNTQLRVSLRYPGHTWIAGNMFMGRGGRLVTLDQLRFGADADLEPGEEGTLPFELWLPARGLRDRRWVVPLMVQASRAEAEPGFDQATVHQNGVLSDLGLERAGRDAPIGHPRPAAQVSLPRWAVIAVCLAVLAAGSVLAVNLWPVPGAEGGSTSARQPAPPPSGSPTQTPRDPFDDYVPLSCDKGNVVFFATVGWPDVDHRIIARYAEDIAFYERERIKIINELGDSELRADLVRISKLSPGCPTFDGFFLKDGPTRANQLTIWYGPVSDDDKATICATLRHTLPAEKRCAVRTEK